MRTKLIPLISSTQFQRSPRNVCNKLVYVVEGGRADKTKPRTIVVPIRSRVAIGAVRVQSKRVVAVIRQNMATKAMKASCTN